MKIYRHKSFGILKRPMDKWAIHGGYYPDRIKLFHGYHGIYPVKGGVDYEDWEECHDPEVRDLFLFIDRLNSL